MTWKRKGIPFLENSDWRGGRERDGTQDHSDAAAASQIQERGRHVPPREQAVGFGCRLKEKVSFQRNV